MKPMQLLFIILFLVLPGITLAHTGSASTTGFNVGFIHPFTGIDHMLAMLAVGIWAALTGGRTNWVVPCVFITVMTTAGIAGITGLSIPYIEQGIIVSIVVLGIFTTCLLKLPLVYSSLIIGCFAVFHGYAHGTEMPLSNNAFSYIAGFGLATVVLNLVGIAIGKLMLISKLKTAHRLAGSTIVLGGIYLAVI